MIQYILTLDIGGTTFSTYLFDQKLEKISSSEINLVSDYIDKNALLDGFAHQADKLLQSNSIAPNQVLGIGVSAPGPLIASEGKILETPNLTLLQHTNLSGELEERLGVPVKIENDANLFAWGEWQKNHPQSKVMVALTLGSGLGVGIVYGGRLFTGAHGMGAEYGISPLSDGVWEDDISIEGLSKKSNELLGGSKTPLALFQSAQDGNLKALEIWTWFGEKLGYCLCHIINLLDPDVIIIGGGLSKAYTLFIDSAKEVLYQYAPSFKLHDIPVLKSLHYLDSIHRGAAMLIKEKKA
ncbi:MAG: ROK family protein [Candidatus Marinimicrobia bacterium]|nr:ROK family protein [Candidatus Neomarinimicrobiota bacterium]